MRKSANLLYIEECIKRIQMKKDVDKNIKCIEGALNREFGSTVTPGMDGTLYYITIINNKTGNFFGASVYPCESTMNRLVHMMLEERPTSEVLTEVWKRSDVWEIELDSILLYDKNLNASAGEILAVLLHELGHVAFSNSVPHRLNKVLRTYKAIQSAKVKKVLESKKITKKIMFFPVLAACSSKNFKVGSTRKELIADDFAFRAGYGEELEQFINKLIINGGNSLVNRSESEMEDDIRVFVRWSVDNLTELNFRKNKLKMSLKTEILRNPSVYTLNIIHSIKDELFGRDDRNLYEQVVQESCLMNTFNRVIKEPSKRFYDKMNRITPVKMRDLDIFQAELTRVKTVDDKIFLLENLHDELDKVQLALDFLHDKNTAGRVTQSKSTLETYRKEIVKLISSAKEIEIKNEKYGLYIEYPAGYEG